MKDIVMKDRVDLVHVFPFRNRSEFLGMQYLSDLALPTNHLTILEVGDLLGIDGTKRKREQINYYPQLN